MRKIARFSPLLVCAVSNLSIEYRVYPRLPPAIIVSCRMQFLGAINRAGENIVFIWKSK